MPTSSWTSGLLEERAKIKLWSTALREIEYKDRIIFDFKKIFESFGLVLIKKPIEEREERIFEIHGKHNLLGTNLENIRMFFPKRRMRELWFPLDIYLQADPNNDGISIENKYYWNSYNGFCEGTWG